jgi:hypothetical protein
MGGKEEDAPIAAIRETMASTQTGPLMCRADGRTGEIRPLATAQCDQRDEERQSQVGHQPGTLMRSFFLQV